MKLSKITMTFALLVTLSAFSDETKFSTYTRVGVKGTVTKSEDDKYEQIIMPACDFGFRRSEGSWATDISAGYSYLDKPKVKEYADYNGEVHTYTKSEVSYSYTFPKAMILRSFFPKSFSTVYMGAGGSFGGVDVDDNKFHGLFGNATIGAEIFNLKEKVLGTFQIDLDVPAIAASSSGDRPYPLVALKIGIGF